MFYVVIFHWALAANVNYEHIRTIFARSRTRDYLSPPSERLYISSADSFSQSAVTDSRRTFIPLALTMLQKMYLISSEHFQKHALAATNKSPLPSKTKRRSNLSPQSDYNKWIKMIERLREDGVTRKAPLKDIANFVKHVLLQTTFQIFQTPGRITLPPFRSCEAAGCRILAIDRCSLRLHPEKTKYKTVEKRRML